VKITSRKVPGQNGADFLAPMLVAYADDFEHLAGKRQIREIPKGQGKDMLAGCHRRKS